MAQPTDRTNGVVRRWLTPEPQPTPTRVFIIVGLLAIASLLSYGTGGAQTAASHAFYIPIVLAAVRFGWGGAALTALAAGVLGGPLLPQDVVMGVPQTPANWLVQAGSFLGIGLLIALFVTYLRTALAREHAVRERERELAVHKGALIQTVSHEFRTPLTVIRGALETLEDHDLVDGTGEELVRGMERAAERLDHLVRSVLAVAESLEGDDRLQAGPVSLTSVLEEVRSSLERYGAADRLLVTYEGGRDGIVSNRELVLVLLRGLVENGLKFSPRDEPVEVHVARDENEARIVVRDHGPGMTPDDLAAVVPFRQGDPSTTREHGGLGLGLFVSTRIAGHLGGELRLESPDGGGTRATVVLPQRRESDRIAEGAGAGDPDLRIDPRRPTAQSSSYPGRP